MVAIKTLKLHEQVAQHKTTAKVAAAYEMSTRRVATGRYETQRL